jgi:uncharacterized protein YfdQ (DUF2303 family)
MSDEETTTGLGTVVAETRSLVEDYIRPEIIKFESEGFEAPVEVSKDGARVLDPASFDGRRASPLFLAGRPQLTTLESLIEYANRHKDGGSVIFADDSRSAPLFNAVLDYHHGGPDAPRFGRHEARYAPPLSDEWKAWHENNGESLSLPEFARFLDDHIVDVMDPATVQFPDEETQRFVKLLGGPARMATPAKLVELTQGISVFEESDVSQATNLQSGEMQLTINNRHTDGAGQPVKIPSMLVIGVPVFQSGELYQVLVRLRYRKSAGGIVFFYELWRDDRVFDHAFNEACDKLAGATELPLFRGRRS